MKGIKLLKQITACALALLLAVPFSAMAQTAASPEKVFRPEELEQMLAPIALYPDALLAQVLTAATYPLELVAADRFAKDNPGLRGEALLEAARDKDWEPSIKAMLGFPDVLAMMDEQLEWTGNLGDAFLAQPGDCMDAVQRLRQKAYAQGNLVTTAQQVIRVEPQTQIIIIAPASPEIVYVPVYDPVIIYGAWWYPAYPPYHFYPRRYFGISFFPGIVVRTFWGVWGTWNCNWHSRDVHIDVSHYNRFTRATYTRDGYFRTYRSGQGDQAWRYDARHRTSATMRSRTIEPRERARPSVYERTTIRKPVVNSSVNVKPSINVPRIRVNDQTNIRRMPVAEPRRSAVEPVINSSVNVKPSINVSRTRVNDQTNIRRMPVSEQRGSAAEPVTVRPSARVGFRNNSAAQRRAITSTATVTEAPRNRASEQIIAQPKSDDSVRNKGNNNIPAAKGRARIMRAEDNDVQAKRQFNSALKESNVMRGGFTRGGGR